jgi:RHS repeat-associated protein
MMRKPRAKTARAIALCAGVIAATLTSVRWQHRDDAVISIPRDGVNVSQQSARIHITLGPEADPQTLQVKVEAEDVTRRFRFAGGRATGFVEGLERGENRLVAAVRDRTGKSHEAETSILVTAESVRSDRMPEFHEVAQRLIEAFDAKRKQPSAPVKVVSAAQAALKLLGTIESIQRSGGHAENERERLRDLATELTALEPEIRRHYAGGSGANSSGDDSHSVEEKVAEAAARLAESMTSAAESSDEKKLSSVKTRIAAMVADPNPEPEFTLKSVMRHIPDSVDVPALELHDVFESASRATDAWGNYLRSDPEQLLAEAIDPPRGDPWLRVGAPPAFAQAPDPDLSPAVGVRFNVADPTDPIVQKAAELGFDPIAIYAFVRNEIEFSAASGGLSHGATTTLLNRRGNNPDQIALLVALLRASGIKARFVVGDVRIHDPKVLSWLQLPSGSAGRISWLASLIGPSVLTVGGFGEDPGSATFHEHWWAKVLVPYGADQGRSGDAPLRWIFLDPSFKEHATKAGITLAPDTFDLGLSGGGYLGSESTRTPFQAFADQRLNDLRAAFPGKTQADVTLRGPIIRDDSGLLPAAPPYRIVKAHLEFADVESLPAAPLNAGLGANSLDRKDLLRTRTVLELREGSTVRLHEEFLQADITHRRVSVVWEPADATEASQIAAECQNDLSLCTTPSTILLRPRAYLDGVAVGSPGSGSPFALGGASILEPFIAGTTAAKVRPVGSDPNDLRSYFSQPLRRLIPGSTLVLAADYGQGDNGLLNYQIEKLLSAYRDAGNAHSGQATFPIVAAERESLIAQLLQVGATRYSARIREGTAVARDLDRIEMIPFGAGQTQAKVASVFLDGTPVAVVPKGLLVDIQYSTRLADLDPSPNLAKEDKFFQLNSVDLSANEHQIWEELTQLDSMSTAKGVQYARTHSPPQPPVVLIPPGGSLPGNHGITGSTLTKINTDLANGMTIVAATGLVTLNSWQGFVYFSYNATKFTSVIVTTAGFASGGETTTFDPINLADLVDARLSGANDSWLRIGDPVNAVSGNLDHTQTDFSLAVPGALPFAVERTYNSQVQEVGPFGYGWTHAFNVYLEVVDDDADGTPNEPADEDLVRSGIRFVDGRGAVRRFALSAGSLTGTFTPETGVRANLVYESAGNLLVLVASDGTRFEFPAFATGAAIGTRTRLARARDPNANTITLTYDASNRLTQVTDPLSRVLSFGYTDPSPLIRSASDWGGRTWTYTYDIDDLIAVTSPLDAAAGRVTNRYRYYSKQLRTANDHNLARAENALGEGTSFFYYSNDKTYKTRDDEGGETRFVYDLFTRTTTEIDALGRTTRHEFDTLGREIRTTNADGTVVDTSYDSVTGQPNRVTNEIGGATQMTYDAFGNLKQLRTPQDATTNYVYWRERNSGSAGDPRLNEVVEVTDPRGKIRNFDYDTRGNLTFETAQMDLGAGLVTVQLRRHDYDARGNRIKLVENIDTATPLINDSVDRVTEFRFDASGLRLASLRDSAGRKLRYFWDVDLGEPDRGLLRRIENRRIWTDPVTSATQVDVLVDEHQYDVLGRPTLSRDALGREIEPHYDPAGRVFETVLRARNSRGALEDRISRVAFDAVGRVVKSIDPLGNVSRTVFDLVGNPIKAVDRSGRALHFFYDARNRLIRSVDPLGNEVNLIRDGLGRVIEEIGANDQRTVRRYDADSRITREEDPDFGTLAPIASEVSYDPAGNVIGIKNGRLLAGQISANSAGFSTSFVYDELGRRTQTRDAQNNLTDISYDLLSNVTSVRDALLHTTSQLFDRGGRLIQRTDPLTRQANFAYDNLGNLISATDRKNQRTLFDYDLASLQLRATYADGRVEVLGFDGFGSQILARSPDVTYASEYDAAGRLLERVDSRFGRKANRFTYDESGRVLSYTGIDGAITQLRYDAGGRLEAIRTPSAGVEVERQYDRSGRLIGQVWTGGVSSTYEYSAGGRAKKIEHRAPNASLLSSIEYTSYDPNGNVVSLRRQGTQNESYLFDSLDRMTSATYFDASVQTFAYDAVGNRTFWNNRNTQRWFCHDAANRLIQQSASSTPGCPSPVVTYTYDNNGNRISRTPSSGASHTYTWDASNRLVQFRNNGTSTNWFFRYDALGQRIFRQEEAESPRNMTWIFGNRAEEYNANDNSFFSRATYGPGVDELVLLQRQNDTMLPQRDALGSAVGYATTAGAQVSRYTYDVFGTTTPDTTLSLPHASVFRFTGRERDTNGLYFLRNRYYDTEVGRFVSEDPSGFGGGINLYAYAANNPARFTDPLGLSPLPTGFAGVVDSIGIFDTLPSCYSTQCRSGVYEVADQRLNRLGVDVDFFGAAAGVSGPSGIGRIDTPDVLASTVSDWLILRDQTESFLRTTSQDLYENINYPAIRELVSGREVPGLEGLRGESFNHAFVDREQERITHQLFGLNEASRVSVIEDLNGLLNNVILRTVDQFPPMRDTLDRDFPTGFSFGRESDRKQLGYGIVDRIRDGN